MNSTIAKVDYYTVTADRDVGAGARLLSIFAGSGVNLLGYREVPIDSQTTEFWFVPDDGRKMIAGAKDAGLELDGPGPAIHIQGKDDDPGECASVFSRLAKAGISVVEGCGVAGVFETWGVIVYLREEDGERAMEALQD